jgi:O-antigen ligase
MKKGFFYRNSLSIVFLILFVFSLIGQFYTGWKEHNNELKDDKYAPISISAYATTGHFISSTFENWESEFLQMALFVILTRTLRQKGSSESKKLEEEEEVDKDPDPNKRDAPWPVHRGGIILALYKHSLSIALIALYLICFLLHTYGSLKDYNDEEMRSGKPVETFVQYLTSSRLWFESFQNWQSEFLSIFAIVILSIYLRQQGSSQSKPVDAANSYTGE